MCGSCGLGGDDEFGGKNSALMRGKVATISGLAKMVRVKFRVWGF